MSIEPSSAIGRLIAIALLVIVIGALGQLVVEPLAAAFTDRVEALSTLSSDLEEYNRRSGSRDQLKKQQEELTRRQGAQVGLLAESNAALAGAALQTAVRRVVEASGGALRSLQVLPTRPEGSLQRLALRVDATLPSGRLLDFLYGSESTVPYLFIENLDLRVPDAVQREGVGPTQISLRAEIASYRRPEMP